MMGVGRLSVVLLALAVILAPTAAAEHTHREPTVEFDIEGLEEIEDIEFDEISGVGEVWTVDIVLNESHAENISSLTIQIQICLNEGLCLTPEDHLMLDQGDDTWSVTILPPFNHTYIHWKIQFDDESGNQTVTPVDSWFIQWSSCHFWDNEWSGHDCVDGGPPADQSVILADHLEGQDDEFNLPAIGALATIGMMTLAILVRRRT